MKGYFDSLGQKLHSGHQGVICTMEKQAGEPEKDLIY